MPPSAPIEAPLSDAPEVLSHLRRGDMLAHCRATGWRLVRADLPVDDLTVRVLMQAPRGGRLVPLDDGLPGIGGAQTWAWAEGGAVSAADSPVPVAPRPERTGDCAMARAVEAAARELYDSAPVRLDPLKRTARLVIHADARAALSAGLRVLAQDPMTRGLRAEDLLVEIDGPAAFGGKRP